MSTFSRRINRAALAVPTKITQTSISYTPGNDHAVLSWSAPASDTPITGYLLARDDGGGVEAGPWSNTYPASQTSLDFLYLKTGTYTFSVAPINARGTGPTTSVRVLVTAGLTAPSQAVAANMTRLTFHDDFDSISTIDFNGTAIAGQGYNWTTQLPFTNDPPASTPENTFVSNSILTLGQNGNNLNQGIFTTNRKTQSHLVGPFQYGYYEAKMKFDPSLIQYDSEGGPTGWPSFWSIGASHTLLINSTEWPELDFFEFAPDANKASGGVYAASIHDHDRTMGPETDYWNTGNNTHDVNPITWNDWHLYGCLWEKGKLTWYFDNIPFKIQTYSATSQSPDSIPSKAGAYKILDDPVDGPATIILGTSDTCPLYVDWVRIWQ